MSLQVMHYSPMDDVSLEEKENIRLLWTFMSVAKVK